VGVAVAPAGASASSAAATVKLSLGSNKAVHEDSAPTAAAAAAVVKWSLGSSKAVHEDSCSKHEKEWRAGGTVLCNTFPSAWVRPLEFAILLVAIGW